MYSANNRFGMESISLDGRSSTVTAIQEPNVPSIGCLPTDHPSVGAAADAQDALHHCVFSEGYECYCSRRLKRNSD